MCLKKPDAPLASFVRGFVYATRGLATCVREERNFRFHLVAAVYVFLLAPCFLTNPSQWGVLILTVTSVLCAEAFNTALERLVDLLSPDKHPLAGAAKDIAAGAVLLTALAAVAVAVFLFHRPDGWQLLFSHWQTEPWRPCVLAVSLIPACLFVFHR